MRSEKEIRSTIALLDAYMKQDRVQLSAELNLDEFALLKLRLKSNQMAIAYLEWVLGGTDATLSIH